MDNSIFLDFAQDLLIANDEGLTVSVSMTPYDDPVISASATISNLVLTYVDRVNFCLDNVKFKFDKDTIHDIKVAKNDTIGKIIYSIHDTRGNNYVITIDLTPKFLEYAA